MMNILSYFQDPETTPPPSRVETRETKFLDDQLEQCK